MRLGGRARDILCVLREADVPGISFTPRRPLAAEGIRNREIWTGTTPGGDAGGRSMRLF